MDIAIKYNGLTLLDDVSPLDLIDKSIRMKSMKVVEMIFVGVWDVDDFALPVSGRDLIFELAGQECNFGMSWILRDEDYIHQRENSGI